MRLQRFLAQAGIASRRKSEDLISAGLIRVNGRLVTEPGTTVDPEADEVLLRGERVTALFAETSPGTAIGVAFHKPAGVLTSRSDTRGRRTVYDLIREPEGERLVYVGRLDLDTEGLLILTTHGALAHRLTHPRWEIEREYRIESTGPLDEAALARAARRGIDLEGGRAGPFRARVLARSGERRTLELVLTEGKKREVRRIVEACGGDVERLVRTRFAFLTLEGLASGRWRRLEREEMARLLALVDLPAGHAGGRAEGEGTWT